MRRGGGLIREPSISMSLVECAGVGRCPARPAAMLAQHALSIGSLPGFRSLIIGALAALEYRSPAASKGALMGHGKPAGR